MKYPYRITSSYSWTDDPSGMKYQQLRSWLFDNIGPAYVDWQSLIIDDKIAVNFVHEKDAILFALRWS